MEFRVVESLGKKYEISEDGKTLRKIKGGMPIKQRQKDCNGVLYAETRVCLGSERRHVFIHQIVAECWLGDKPHGCVIDHIDRDSLNNDWHNLRYVTRAENFKNSNYWDKKIFSKDKKTY